MIRTAARPLPSSRLRARALLRALTLATILALTLPAAALAYDWPAVPAADLALAAPQVESGANAEVLLWRMVVEDSYKEGLFVASQEHLVRVKLFDQQAVQERGTMRIPYTRSERIDELDARTVLPDGRVLPVPPNAFFEQVVERRGRDALRFKTFAPPGLVPGAVVEYHVRFHLIDRFSNFLPIPLQIEFPVRRLELRVHPLDFPTVRMMYRTFQGAPVEFNGVGNGDFLAVVENLRAFRDEPWMPPDDQVRKWVLLYYQIGDQPTSEEFWRDFAHSGHKAFLEGSKVTEEVRDAALAATAGVADTLERVHRLFDLCRSSVRNLSADTTLTDSERARRKSNASPAQTLERGIGTEYDVLMLFASMLRACGLDARRVAINQRTGPKLDLNFTQPYLVRSWDVAVPVGGRWVILDPSAAWLPFGMLHWDEEGATAIVTGPGEPLVTRTLLSDERASQRTSTADLALAEDGTLDGALRVTLTGHLAAERKRDDLDRAPGARIDTWKRELQDAVGTLDVLEPRILPRTDPAAPYVFTCRVHAAGFAQRTGRRLIVQPSFFRRGAPALFPASTRRYPVAFPYPWSETDSVRIRVPEGFVAEAWSEPAPELAFGMGRFATGCRMLEDGRTMLDVRTFDIGEGGGLAVQVGGYAAIKGVFDTIRERDGGSVVLTAAAGR